MPGTISLSLVFILSQKICCFYCFVCLHDKLYTFTFCMPSIEAIDSCFSFDLASVEYPGLRAVKSTELNHRGIQIFLVNFSICFLNFINICSTFNKLKKT